MQSNEFVSSGWLMPWFIAWFIASISRKVQETCYTLLILCNDSLKSCSESILLIPTSINEFNSKDNRVKFTSLKHEINNIHKIITLTTHLSSHHFTIAITYASYVYFTGLLMEIKTTISKYLSLGYTLYKQDIIYAVYVIYCL